MCICEICIEAIRSHGEPVKIIRPSVGYGTCEWCDEEDELVEVEL